MGVFTSLHFFDVSLCEYCPCLSVLTAQWTVFNVAIRWSDKVIPALLELQLPANWVGTWDLCVLAHVTGKHFCLEEVIWELKVLPCLGEKCRGWAQQLWAVQSREKICTVMALYLLGISRGCMQGSFPKGNTVSSGWWQYFVFHFRALVQVPKVQWSWSAGLSFIQGKHRKCCWCTGLCTACAESSSSVWD